jgi:competence protein ComFB
MAKKSNKTEQVLKLITKEGDVVPESSVELDVKTPEKKEHKIEAKLKIEIEPEIEIKQKEKPLQETIKVEAKSVDKYNDVCKGENRCLVNLTEHIVREKAEEIMHRLGVCTCPVCRLDVLALALNSLPNKFITTDKGRLHLKLEIYKKQYETDVVSALTKACVRVKASPRHDE